MLYEVMQVDRDQTTLSRKIGMYQNATPETAITIRVPDLQEAYSQMAKGKIDAVVVIPVITSYSIHYTKLYESQKPCLSAKKFLPSLTMKPALFSPR